MTAGELLRRLQHAGVELWAEGERLRYDAPAEALTDELLARLRAHKPELLELVRAAGRRVQLAPTQVDFWLLDALHPAEARANEQFAIALDGPLDMAVLDAAWQRLIGRHEILRARFGADGGEPWQCFDAPPAPPRWLGRLTPAALAAHAAAEALRAFDLGAGGLLRAGLAQFGPESHCLLVTAHHIVADGLSVPLIRDELARAYADAGAGRETGAAADIPQFTEFVRWRRAEAADAGAAVHWWRQRLAGLPPGHGLPETGAAAAPGGAMHRVPFAIDTGLAARLRALARDEGATLFTLLAAALRVLLVRHGAVADLALATPVTWRDEPRRRRTIGCLVETVLLRTPLADHTPFDALLRAERDGLLAALGRRAAPLAQVVAALGDGHGTGARPAARILFQFDTAAAPQVAAGVAFRIEPVMVDRASHWDLEWSVTDHGPAGGLAGHLCFARGRFDAVLFGAMPHRLATLLAAIARTPQAPVGELALLDADERAAVLTTWNDTARAYPATATLHGLVAARWRMAPQAVALRTVERDWSAGELGARVAALAARLQARGVGPGERVAVALEPSAELVIALVAILRTGAAYVPLDPAYPRERLAFMLVDSAARLLVTTRALSGSFVADSPPRLELDACDWQAPLPAPLSVADTPDSAACILYTSGSTGEPKGAVNLHRGAVNRCHWMWQEYGFGAGDVFCLRTSSNFVDSLWEIFGALVHGIPLVVLPGAAARDPALLVPLLARYGVTQLVLVPPLLRALLEYEPALGARLPRLATIITSGEALPPDLWAQARTTLPAARLVNTYGTSEIWDATACDTSLLAGTPRRIPIGRPLANVRCYVLDGRMQPVPPGVAGELCVGGVGVGGGYWRRPALTAERFVPDPFVPGPQALLYRTGDLARQLPDGSFECLGRSDRQLKLRGHRLEPGEIEALLRRCPGVRDAAVDLDGSGAQARLVAWVDTGDAQPRPELVAIVCERLPEPLRPSAWVWLTALPLTPSGKVDRSALLAPPHPGAAGPQSRMPAGEGELAVAALWAEVLGVAEVDATSSFFALGGHSLLAMRLLARASVRFGTTLTLQEFFAGPTVAGMAARLAAAPPVAAVLPRAGRAGPLPLSFAQERLWFLAELDPASPAYHIAWTVVIEGRLDLDRLQAALDALLLRHEALRTTFPAEDGQPRQRIHAQLAVPVAVEQVAADELPVRRAALAALRFDLARGPLVRVTLLSAGPRVQELLVVVHHAVSDGTSNGILFRELAALYRGEQLAPLPAQYADFAAWQRRALDEAACRADLDWWRATLAGAPPLLELPVDFPRPRVQGFRGAWVWRSLAAAPAARLAALARARDCTPYMLLLAAFSALLQRCSGQDDVLVGTPVSARPHADLEGVVGLFVNTIVLRTDLAGDPSFAALLARVRTVATAAFAHQALPFERLVQALQPERTLAHAPLFQVMFNLVPIPERVLEADGACWRLGRLVDHGVATFDLTLTVGEYAEGLDLVFEYDTALFLPATIARLADGFLALLEQLPDQIDTPLSGLPLFAALQSPASPAAQLAGAGLPTVPALFAQRAAAAPQAPALVWQDRRWTYAELEWRAALIAGTLAARGIGRGARVAVCLERGPDLIAAVLGVMRAGAAFVALDPAQPAARLQALLADADVALILAAAEAFPRGVAAGAIPVLDPSILFDVAGTLPIVAAGAAQAATPSVTVTDIAYLVYTSGSTGTPKGVVVTHGNLAATWQGWAEAYAPGPGDRHLQMAPAAFDVFIGDLVRALASGGCLVLCPREVLLEPHALHALMRRESVTIAEFVPATLRALLAWLGQTGGDLAFMRLVIVGSDTWHAHEYRDLVARCGPRTRVINSYGVAEATIDSTWFEGEPPASGPLPIGRPFAPVAIEVRDGALRPLPPGVPGEIVIAGAGVARGYWRREALTAARFVADPAVPGRRLYRTGDRGRQRADGQFELLGRLDRQLKLRGLRIEAGEVEAALVAHPRVRAAVVDLRETAGADQRLVAWVAADAPWPAAAELRAALHRRLPDYMVPAHVVVCDALPLMPNGKLDRRALPDPDWSGADTGALAPRTAHEALLAELWADVLGLDRAAGVDEDFFALGGHSLLAARLVARVRDALGVELPLRVLFDAPTVAGVAAALPQAAPCAGPPLRAAPTATGGRCAPLSPTQQRLWFLDQIDPGTATWNLHLAWRLRGEIDVALLELALQALVARHEALRTTFGEAEEGPELRVAAVGREFAARAAPAGAGTRGSGASRDDVPVPPDSTPSFLEQLDLAPGTDVRALLAGLAARPFDLTRGPLLRAVLVAAAPGDHHLLLVLHHIIADGWSLAVLARELGTAYRALLRGVQPAWAPLPVQYADYAFWQRQALTEAASAAGLHWWRSALAGAPPLVSLPLDRPRPAVQRHRGAWHTRRLPADIARAIRTLARREHATPFMVLLAGFATLLARYGGDEELVIGTPVAGRGRTELEGLVGFFVNTLALRVDLQGDPTFAALVGRVRRTALEAFAHAEVPFEQVVEALAPPRSRAWTPLVQVFFAWHNEPRAALALDGIGVEPVVLEGTQAKFDLSLHVAEHDGGIVASFNYDTDLFDEVTVRDLAGSYEQLLREVSRDGGMRVGEVELLDTEQRAAVVHEAARVRPVVTVAAVRECFGGARTLGEAFTAQVARTPQRTAVSWFGESLRRWSYLELHHRAQAVALQLGAVLAPGRAPVALLLGHDGVMVAGLLGAVLAGRAYVPVDPWQPQARLAAVLDDSGACAVVTDTARLAAAPWLRESALPLVLADAAPGTPGTAQSAGPPDRARAVSGEAAAYLLYTSGSTGRPKGVVQTHAGVLGQVGQWCAQLGIGMQDRLSLVSGYGYDAAVQDLFGALLSGASLQALDLRGGRSAPELVDVVAGERLTLLHLTPTVYRYLFGGRVTCAQDLSAVRLVVLGGEAARRSDLELFKVRFARGARLVNGLGLTESTMGLQYFADHATRVLGPWLPVGLAVAGTRALVVDAAGRAGSWRGELVLESGYLSAGYHGDAALTAARYREVVPAEKVAGEVAAGAAPTEDGGITGEGGTGAVAAGAAPTEENGTPAGEGPVGALPSAVGAARAATVAGTGDLAVRRLSTRDRVRRLPDGQLVHAGRLDRQVKIRGLRVEPAEVEAALVASGLVGECAVVAVAGEAGEPELAAYVVGAAPAEALRAALRGRLPPWLVPASFTPLAQLPRLANGKVDRAALPAPVGATPVATPLPEHSVGAAPAATPATAAIERRLTEIWCRLLGRREIGLHEDFFALGGHSLLATRLIARVRDAFALEVPLLALFESPTIAGLAARLAAGADPAAAGGPIPRRPRAPARPLDGEPV